MLNTFLSPAFIASTPREFADIGLNSTQTLGATLCDASDRLTTLNIEMLHSALKGCASLSLGAASGKAPANALPTAQAMNGLLDYWRTLGVLAVRTQAEVAEAAQQGALEVASAVEALSARLPRDKATLALFPASGNALKSSLSMTQATSDRLGHVAKQLADLALAMESNRFADTPHVPKARGKVALKADS